MFTFIQVYMYEFVGCLQLFAYNVFPVPTLLRLMTSRRINSSTISKQAYIYSIKTRWRDRKNEMRWMMN